MNDRLRTFSAGMQIVTLVVIVGLLVFVVLESQNIAEQKAAAVEEAAERNRALLQELSDQQAALRRAQADQRRAFRALARRNEVLHGRDPAEAPEFSVGGSSNPQPQRDPPADREPRDEPSEPERRPDPREPEPRDPPKRDPPPDEPDPRPTPDPICVPIVDVCLGQ